MYNLFKLLPGQKICLMAIIILVYTVNSVYIKKLKFKKSIILNINYNINILYNEVVFSLWL